MSNPQTSFGRPEKTMSSRLLTMKFMQRAAASSTPSTPQTPEGPPSKRRRTSNDESPVTNPGTDAQAFQAAADAEDAKRVAAIERLAAEAGETKWVLSTVDTEQSNGTNKKLRFFTAGYSDIDQDTQMTERQSSVGRRSFGRFNKEIEKLHDNAKDSTSSSSADGSEHGDTYNEDEGKNDSTDPTEALIREEALRRAKADRKARKKAQKAEAARLAESRRSKEVKLNKLSSISGGGGGGTGVECHFCGQKGHKKADCPRKAKLKRREEVR
ncbi:MAG: hypothetical protein Q9225_000760 [Loekoesia sp. 1 TL-2023]